MLGLHSKGLGPTVSELNLQTGFVGLRVSRWQPSDSA